MDFDTVAILMQPGDPGLDLLLEALRSRPEWMAQAACRGSGVDFFPPAPARGIAPDEGPALAVCGGCSVIARCREFAEENSEQGVWGGSTGRQRRARSSAA